MHYSNGNYEAFVKADKPKDVDQKSAYIVGSGLAALATAVFLIRDGQMKGEKIHIFEELGLPGGSMDGIYNKEKEIHKPQQHRVDLYIQYRPLPFSRPLEKV